MKVDVFEGTATLSMEVPIFVGTTGKGEPGATNFPILGAPLKNFMFYPEKDDSGTLVFDLADEKRRTATSPIYFQYWWFRDKLTVREGLCRACFFNSFLISNAWGLMFRPEPGNIYHHLKVSDPESGAKLVPVLDLLRFLEGKIDEDQLKELIIK